MDNLKLSKMNYTNFLLKKVDIGCYKQNLTESTNTSLYYLYCDISR